MTEYKMLAFFIELIKHMHTNCICCVLSQIYSKKKLQKRQFSILLPLN